MVDEFLRNKEWEKISNDPDKFKEWQSKNARKFKQADKKPKRTTINLM